MSSIVDLNDRSQADALSREALQQLKVITDNMAASVTRCSRDLRYLWVSRNYAARLGRPPEDIAGKPILEVIGQEAYESIRPHIEKVLSGQREEYEAQVDFLGNGARWVHAVYVPTRNSAHEVDGWIGVVTDVTARREAEERLLESEERFRTLANAAPVMIWVSGPDKLCTFFNKPWLDFTGRPMSLELGNGWAEGVHPDDLERCLELHTSSFDARHPFRMEYRLRRADGEYRWILDHGAPLYQEGGFTGFIGSCVDITEQKLMADRLLAQRVQLVDAQRLANLGSWERDLQNNTLDCSDELVRILGTSDPPLTLAEYMEFVHPGDRERLSKAAARVYTSVTPIEVSYRIIRADGEMRFVRAIFEAIRDNRGAAIHTVGALQDVTEQVQAAEALRESEGRLRALTAHLVELQESGMKSLARELHDDLSQNLAALALEISTLIPSSGKPPQAFSEKIRALRGRVEHMAGDVHAISRRLHPAILDDLGLEAALREECTRFSDRTGIPVEFESNGMSTRPEAGVSLCFYRVTQEALHNVAKHARATNVRVTLSGAEGACLLRIEDDGRGFDPGGAKDRSSLGLISMQERARLVNGNFTIQSEPGKGTRVQLSVALLES